MGKLQLYRKLNEVDRDLTVDMFLGHDGILSVDKEGQLEKDSGLKYQS
jgi:hypothetical protein